jgi:hypothetical protein
MHSKPARIEDAEDSKTIDLPRFHRGEAYWPIPDVSHLANVLLRFHRDLVLRNIGYVRDGQKKGRL